MGIPSYFFQLIKKHKHIISTYKSSAVDNLYLDSNSIIYDVVHSMPTLPLSEFEDEVIVRVCLKLLSYLDMIQPSRVFIAFDGVPPMAKMKQQKERRYKGWLLSQTLKESKPWDTVQITPGTNFMKKLDDSLTLFFEPIRKKYASFHLSTSQEAGEGEHKLFSFIRANDHSNQTTMIYGLDSDLIILALNHLEFCNKIVLLREAPAFMIKDKGSELHLLDINALSASIQEIMGQDKLNDYIFMTLLLGNDFMPHFPALNLRTTGMDTLLTTYVETMQNKIMFDGKTIHWDAVRDFITALSSSEEFLFKKEYTFRNNRYVDSSTLEKKTNNLPMIHREKEHIICPLKPGWQFRYYATLLPGNTSDICENYVAMMEWNIRYYTTGCTNWTLYYKYAYPPLLEDLAKNIPAQSSLHVDMTIATPHQLLAYVLPHAQLHYLPHDPKVEPKVESKVEPKVESKVEPKVEWSFCTYMWEAHVI
jgi:5'-3' exonuclease